MKWCAGCGAEEQHLLLGKQKTAHPGGFFLVYGCFHQDNQLKEDIRESWLCFNHWQTQQIVYTINQFVTHHSMHWKYCDRCSFYCIWSWQQMEDAGILPSKIQKFSGLFIQHVTFPLRSATLKNLFCILHLMDTFTLIFFYLKNSRITWVNKFMLGAIEIDHSCTSGLHKVRI